jgi:predicted RNA-binding protein YlxR (DUF448 family)
LTTPERNVPLRTCIICGNKTSKRELVRIVASPDGDVAMDHTARMQGRGTYVCRSGNCSPQGLKRGRLEYALRIKLEDEKWTRIVMSVEALGAAV